MDFRLGDELEAVADLAGRILRDLSTGERLAALDGWLDREAWAALSQAGLLAVALPSRDGGSDLGFLGAHVVLAEVGRAAAQVPYWETVVLGALPLATFGTGDQRRSWLPRLASGEALATAALGDDGPTGTTTPAVTATAVADGWELSGTRSNVPLAPAADLILVPAAVAESGVGVWLVDVSGPGVEIHPQEVITGQPYGEVVLTRAALPPQARLGEADGTVHRWLLRHGAAGLASMTAGICDAAVRLSAEHTSRREQFGRPVATFQAVAQRIADAFIDAEGVALTALQAAWRLSEGLPADDEIAIAKWWAADGGHRVLHAAHHVHGGVGVDREYPLPRYFAMAKQTEFLLGGASAQLLSLGRALAAEPA